MYRNNAELDRRKLESRHEKGRKILHSMETTKNRPKRGRTQNITFLNFTFLQTRKYLFEKNESKAIIAGEPAETQKVPLKLPTFLSEQPRNPTCRLSRTPTDRPFQNIPLRRNLSIALRHGLRHRHH